LVGGGAAVGSKGRFPLDFFFFQLRAFGVLMFEKRPPKGMGQKVFKSFLSGAQMFFRGGKRAGFIINWDGGKKLKNKGPGNFFTCLVSFVG